MSRFAYHRTRVVAALTLGWLLAGAASSIAQPANKKVLTFADYDIWRSSSGVTLSRDGRYVAYLVGAEAGDGEAVVRHIASGEEFRFPSGAATGVAALGTAPQFTPDSKMVLLPLAPLKAALDKAKADKLKTEDYPKAALAIIDVRSGKELGRIAGVSSFQVGGEGDGFLIYRKSTPPEPGKSESKTPPSKGKGIFPFTSGASPKSTKTYGSDLFIHDLASGATRTILNVTEYSFSIDEQTLVYTVSSKTEEKNGIYTLNPKFGTGGTALKAGPGRYSNITWNEKQTKLAFFYDDSQVPAATLAPPPHPAGKSVGTPIGITANTPPPRNRVYLWDRDANANGDVGKEEAMPLREVIGPDAPGLKKGWTLTNDSLSFAQDGTKLYVATAPQCPPQTTPTTDEIQLDLWHWKDAATQPMQKLRANADRTRTYGAVVLLDTNELRHLSDEAISVQQPGTGDWAVSTDDRKYRHMTGYAFPVPSDYSIVNVRTGEAKLLFTASGTGVTHSPNGEFLLGFDGKDWFTLSVPDGKKVNLTAKLGVKFFEEEHDSPSDPPSYGGVMWATDGKSVLVSDRYDIWKLAADGTGAENLTKIGRTRGIRFTLLRPRSPEDRTPSRREMDLSKPHLLGAVNLTTRDTGFYRLEPGATPKMLLMGARGYSFPTKAKDADVYLLTVQSFSEYPDYYVTGPDFHELKRVTDINPKVKEYNWGKAELIKYTSTDGTPLQGILIKPENFDPTKKYPMVVYIYERLSENVHQFRVPNVTRGQVINPTFYASNGYLVLMPDIAYKVGFPGPSAIKCVLPAIQAVVDKGFVNEAAIGINGQSWGGYQIAYMVTQTNRFKAAVAGAPVSNMVSAYGGIRWGSGLPRQFQYEKTQSRIGATLWESPLRYIENSPIFMADRVQTPLLMIHNDQDDAVPWYQGIEYFLALRRLGKEVYLLNYNGEPHNLAKKAAARDFAMRMFQFFEHHLKEKPAPQWMEKGVPFIDRDKEREQWRK